MEPSETIKPLRTSLTLYHLRTRCYNCIRRMNCLILRFSRPNLRQSLRRGSKLRAHLARDLESGVAVPVTQNHLLAMISELKACTGLVRFQPLHGSKYSPSALYAHQRGRWARYLSGRQRTNHRRRPLSSSYYSSVLSPLNAVRGTCPGLELSLQLSRMLSSM